MSPPDVVALLRDLAPRVLATLARRYDGFDRCENAVQEALVAASVQWPVEGVPDNPAGWLVRVAARRWIEAYRQDEARRRRELAVGVVDEAAAVPVPPGRDDSLTLLTLCCHPALPRPAQVALTLRAVGGLTTREIAHGLLLPEATVAQRISRAKARLRAAGARFTPPDAADRADRVDAVLEVLYLVFTEGHTASAGPGLHRVELAGEAVRLARLLHAAVPDDGEVAGLLALVLLTHARRRARTDDDGGLVPLAEQDRSRWDRPMIEEGVALLEATLPTATIGPYQLQAAIAAVHAEAPSAAATDWPQILGLYDVLVRVAPGPMVGLGRAVAVAEVRGPAAGLAALAAVEPELAGHHRVDVVRAHLLAAAGDDARARAAYRRAAAATANVAEREHLLGRAAALRPTEEETGRMLPTLAGPLRNWAGNLTFTPTELARPSTVEELQELVVRSPRVRALGSGHSFSPVADSEGVLVSVRDLGGEIEVDPATGAVSVPAGATYGRVGAELQRAGRALHNTGSLPHIVVAGACATGTHGSGNGNQNLPSAVRAVEFVRADGELVTLSREADPDEFGGAVLTLGALGIVTRLTLDTEVTYDVRQDLWQDVPFDRLVAEVDDVMDAHYSVSVFTDWSRPDVVDKVWTKSRVVAFTDHPDDWLGGRRATEAQHPIVGEDTAGATEQLGVAGPWNARLPHFRIEFTPSHGEEIQSEYLLPREHTAEALVALRGLAGRFPGVLQVFELRTIAADELWLSPSHRRDTVALHFTWVLDTDRVRPVLGAVEAAIARFEPRPHWGKVFTIPADEVRPRYPRLADAAALVARYDPDGRFRNAFTDPYLRQT